MADKPKPGKDEADVSPEPIKDEDPDAEYDPDALMLEIEAYTGGILFGGADHSDEIDDRYISVEINGRYFNVEKAGDKRRRGEDQ